MVKESLLILEQDLARHRFLSQQIFAEAARKQKEDHQTLTLQLMAGEVSMQASGTIHSDSVYVPNPPVYKEEISGHPDDHVIRSTCEQVTLAGGIKTCQHGILCKERR